MRITQAGADEKARHAAHCEIGGELRSSLDEIMRKTAAFRNAAFELQGKSGVSMTCTLPVARRFDCMLDLPRITLNCRANCSSVAP